MAIGQTPQHCRDTQGQQQHASTVEANRCQLAILAGQVAPGHHHAHHTGRQYHQEHRPPGQGIHQHPSDGRGNRRPQHHAKPIDSHGLAAPVKREDLKDGNHGQRLYQPGQQTLSDTGRHQQRKLLTDSTDNGHDDKQPHGQQIGTTGTESLGTPGIEQHAHGHGSKKAGGGNRRGGTSEREKLAKGEIPKPKAKRKGPPRGKKAARRSKKS